MRGLLLNTLHERMARWGWPYSGRTGRKSRAQKSAARFAADVRNRPLTLLKGLLGFGFILVLVLPLLFALN